LRCELNAHHYNRIRETYEGVVAAVTGNSHTCVSAHTDMGVIIASVSSSLKVIITKGLLNEEGQQCQ